MLDPVDLEAKLLAAFPDAQIELTDLTGTRDHYALKLATRAFSNKSRLEQHRMVYAALGPSVGSDIHALALETSVPT